MATDVRTTRKAAEYMVARVLSELEKLSDCTVESVDIIDIDTTIISDVKPHSMRSVHIELKAKPGAHWDVGDDA